MNHAHSIVAYRYEMLPGGKARIYVYEVNDPYEVAINEHERWVELDIQRNSFSYQSTVKSTKYSTDEGYYLATMPLSVLADPQVHKLSYRFALVAVAGVNSVVSPLAKVGGKTIGFVKDKVVNTIDGAMFYYPFAGASNRLPIFVLPPDNTYTTEVTGKSQGTYDYVHVEPAVALHIADIPIGAGGKDTVVLNAPNRQYTLRTTESAKHISPTLLTRDASSTRVYTLDAISLARNEELTVKARDDATLLVKNIGQKKSYQLELEYFTVNTHETFVSDRIQLQANDTHVIQPQDWERLDSTKVQIKIDHGSDGTIDETMNVSRESLATYLPSVVRQIPPRNRVPHRPSGPSPLDGASSLNIGTDIYWSGGDPDGDQVTYDIYFGKSNPPPKVASGRSGGSFDPGVLEYNTTYYWQIVARDSRGATTVGPIWSFRTGCNTLGGQISFRAEPPAISPGQCTMLRWDVDNVQEVHVGDTGGTMYGVSGHGEQQLCPSSSRSYDLRVLTNDNQILVCTVTIFVR